MFERDGRGAVDHLDFAFDHIDFAVFEVSIGVLEDSDGDEAVNDLGDEGTRPEFSEVVFVELFGVDFFIKGVVFRMKLGAVPDKFDSVLFFEEIVQREVRNRKLVPHREFSEGDIEFLLLR